MNDQSHLLMSLSYTLDDPRVPGEMRKAAAEITRLTEERDALADDRDGYVQLLTDQNTRLTAGSERLRAALRECEAELNAYYRMEYPSDHPYSQKKLSQAMASNPATVALKEKT